MPSEQIVNHHSLHPYIDRGGLLEIGHSDNPLYLPIVHMVEDTFREFPTWDHM
jgi:hypothetical protein